MYTIYNVNNLEFDTELMFNVIFADFICQPPPAKAGGL